MRSAGRLRAANYSIILGNGGGTNPDTGLIRLKFYSDFIASHLTAFSRS